MQRKSSQLNMKLRKLRNENQLPVGQLQSWTKLLRKCHIPRAFFLTWQLYRFLPSPPPLGRNVVVCFKATLILGCLQETTLTWGKGDLVPQISCCGNSFVAYDTVHEGVKILKQFCPGFQLNWLECCTGIPARGKGSNPGKPDFSSIRLASHNSRVTLLVLHIGDHVWCT